MENKNWVASSRPLKFPNIPPPRATTVVMGHEVRLHPILQVLAIGYEDREFQGRVPRPLMFFLTFIFFYDNYIDEIINHLR